MNRIIREHYPAANLPEDLREGLAKDATVKVVVEVEPSAQQREALLDLAINAKPLAWEEILAMREKLLSTDRPSVSTEEAVARIRELRDEWDN
jgi:hypothetical protein